MHVIFGEKVLSGSIIIIINRKQEVKEEKVALKMLLAVFPAFVTLFL